MTLYDLVGHELVAALETRGMVATYCRETRMAHVWELVVDRWVARGTKQHASPRGARSWAIEKFRQLLSKGSNK